MSRYPLAQHSGAQGHAGNAGVLHTSLKLAGREDRDSQSPSDDGSAYFNYPKSENELEGAHTYLSLTTHNFIAAGR